MPMLTIILNVQKNHGWIGLVFRWEGLKCRSLFIETVGGGSNCPRLEFRSHKPLTPRSSPVTQGLFVGRHQAANDPCFKDSNLRFHQSCGPRAGPPRETPTLAGRKGRAPME